jgi:hypothetical protein
MFWLRSIVAVLGVAGALMAQQQPRCEKQMLGQFWPEDANHSSVALQRAVRCGDLQLCTQGRWSQRWKVVSMPYWRMLGKAAPEACVLAESAQADPQPIAARSAFPIARSELQVPMLSSSAPIAANPERSPRN